MVLLRLAEEESETGGYMEELMSALEAAKARVEELLAQEENGAVFDRLEQVKFNLTEACLILLGEDK